MNRTNKRGPGMFAKLSAAFILAGLLPLLLISQFFLGQFTDNIRRIVLNDSRIVLLSASGYVDAMLNEWETRTTELYSRSVDQGIYLGDVLSDREMSTQQKDLYIRRFLAGFSSLNGLKSIRFLDSRGHLYYNSETVGKVINAAEMERWRAGEVSERIPDHHMTLTGLHEDHYFSNINDTVITLERDLFDVSSIKTVNNYLGTIYLDISSEAIGQQLTGINLGSRSGFYIIDQSGGEVYKSPEQTSISQEMQTQIAASFTTGVSVIEDESFYYLIHPNAAGDWISTIRIHKGDILDTIRTSERYILTMLAVSSVVLLILYMAFSRRISIPIRRLKEGMEQIQEGNLDTRVTITSRDEVGILADGLNQMARQLSAYIEQVYGAELRQRKAELNALKSQIKPHYLYNTLDIIRMTAIEHEDRQTAEMIESLARQLRYLTDQATDTVPLKMELDNCSDYFSLIQVRYENKVHLSISVSEELQHIPVLKLILQPIVENAVKHGLKPAGGRGTVWISAARINELLELTVMDDGAGMPAQILDSLNEKLNRAPETTNPPGTGGVGLVNVAERIRNRYGADYGICVESTPDMGTIVIIRIPAPAGTS